MGLADGGDDAYPGLGDVGEGPDLSGLVGAHLQDQELGVVWSHEDGLGKADPVVQVPGGRVDSETP